VVHEQQHHSSRVTERARAAFVRELFPPNILTNQKNLSGQLTHPPKRNAPCASLATVAGWITNLLDPHAGCRRDVAQLAAMITNERDRHRHALADALPAAISEAGRWLEQRATCYRADSTTVAIAVAAELRQCAIDIEHLLARRQR
jgi:hypothetical protein